MFGALKRENNIKLFIKRKKVNENQWSKFKIGLLPVFTVSAVFGLCTAELPLGTPRPGLSIFWNFLVYGYYGHLYYEVYSALIEEFTEENIVEFFQVKLILFFHHIVAVTFICCVISGLIVSKVILILLQKLLKFFNSLLFSYFLGYTEVHLSNCCSRCNVVSSENIYRLWQTLHQELIEYLYLDNFCHNISVG